MAKPEEDPDWGRKCPYCGEQKDTHKYKKDEWICFRCVSYIIIRR